VTLDGLAESLAARRTILLPLYPDDCLHFRRARELKEMLADKNRDFGEYAQRIRASNMLAMN
jgi:hypothetical protein